MRTYRTYRAYRNYKRYKYAKFESIKKRIKLVLICIMTIILFTQVYKLTHVVKISHKAKEARSQAPYVQKGYKQDSKTINHKDKAAIVAELLTKELGKPYVYGSEGPDSFDCSGLVKYVFSKVDISIPRTASDQASYGIPVDVDSLRFGDLLFFSMDNSKITHTGIYIGNGYFEHAPKSGDVVKISSLDSEYYRDAFVKAMRVLI